MMILSLKYMHQTRLEGNFVYFVTTVVQDRIKFFKEHCFASYLLII